MAEAKLVTTGFGDYLAIGIIIIGMLYLLSPPPLLCLFSSDSDIEEVASSVIASVSGESETLPTLPVFYRRPQSSTLPLGYVCS